MILKYLIEKEFKQIRRNSFLPKMILMFPIVMMLVIPWITNLEVKNISLRVVDNDRSTTSQRMVHEMEASNYFIFRGLSPSYDDAIKEVELGRADIIAVIPQHYERDLVNNLPTHVLVAANSVNGTKGGMGSAYLSSIITPSTSRHEPISVLNLFNKYQDYKVFMIPALMAILLILMCGFMPALNIVGEKEAGTIEQINVTPVSKFSFIIAKIIPYWVIGMFVMAICFVLSWAVYGITSAGSLSLIFLLAILMAFTMSSLGLIISNYSDTMQQAMLVMWFCMVCFILLSGLFTPVRSMPDWAQTLTIINPMRYFIDGMRTVFIRGGNALSISYQLISLSVFASVMSLWAMWSYKKNN
jgi:ABC-2 type transport system permease protein